MSSVALALGLALVPLAVNDFSLIRQSKIESLEAQVKMLGFNSAGVLSFRDSDAAAELLSSLAMFPAVELACLYDESGNVFASFEPNPSGTTNEVPLNGEGHRLTESGYIEIHRFVVENGEHLGSIYLLANTSDLQSQIVHYLKIGGLVVLAAVLSSTLLSIWLQRAISGPIGELAGTAKEVTSKRDYSIRVNYRSTNEVGQLCTAFNEMLSEVQISKSALQAVHAELEDRVEERTKQLTAEIEQRRSTQKALERARDSAEAANKAKSEFLANMSHEIRTPLNGILGFAELLANGADGDNKDTRREFLETITTSGQHLLGLINDILDLSKIEAGQMNYERSPCSPHDVINQVVSVLRVKAQEKGLRLTYSWSSKVPEYVHTDEARLRQLLMNLVGNAIKFTDQGSVEIDAELDRDSNQLLVRVIDTGIGIPAEKQPSIFDPFVQADNSVTRRYGGTGLGLAICRRLSGFLGGDLRVESQPGKGSVFSLSIDTGPLQGVDLLDAPPAEVLKGLPHRNIVSSTASISGTNILLVEDGEINRKLVRIMLEEAGAKVSCAENGWVGVELASKKDFSLILMDMQMPIMDGYAAAAKLREQGLETPIVALTAHAMKGDEQKCLDAGCTAYLTKPIQATILLETISSLLVGNSKDVPILSTVPDQSKNSSTELRSTLPLDQPIYRQIVDEFVEYLNEHVTAMQCAYSDGRFEDLAELAHALKGAGGTAGFDALTKPSAALESSAKDQSPEGIESTLTELLTLTQDITETPQVPSN